MSKDKMREEFEKSLGNSRPLELRIRDNVYLNSLVQSRWESYQEGRASRDSEVDELKANLREQHQNQLDLLGQIDAKLATLRLVKEATIGITSSATK